METQQGFTLWLTGMSGAGKSTLAQYLAKRLPLVGKRVEILDMSELEEILPEAPDADRETRDRNVRTLGWAAQLLTRNGVVPIVAAVSPYREVREEQRREIGRFFEIFVDCSFEVLMERDSKGIYRRALSGELQDVVGVQSPYEPPVSAEVRVDMGRGKVEEVAREVFDRLVNHGYLSRKERDVLVDGSGPSKASKAKREAKIAAVRAAAKKAAKAAAMAPAAKTTAKAPAAKTTAKAPKTPAKGARAAPTKTAKAAKGTTAKAATKAAKTTKAATAKAPTKAAKATTAKTATKAAKATKAATAKVPTKAAKGTTAKTATKAAKATKAATAKAPAKTAKTAKAPTKASTKATKTTAKTTAKTTKAPAKAAKGSRATSAKAAPKATGAKAGRSGGKAKASKG